jgi:hypothetical protein
MLTSHYGSIGRIEGAPVIYRLYLFDTARQFVAGRWFEAAHDRSALKITQRERRLHEHTYAELWQDGRKLNVALFAAREVR